MEQLTFIKIRKQNTHGGKREGSGRKQGANQTAKTYRIDNDLLEYLNTKKNKNKFINDLIRSSK